MEDRQCRNIATGPPFGPDSVYSIPRAGTMGVMLRLYSHADTDQLEWMRERHSRHPYLVVSIV